LYSTVLYTGVHDRRLEQGIKVEEHRRERKQEVLSISASKWREERIKELLKN
jgi:hypothetical protein